MNILYYDCFSGISGDMNLAAMIDLGVPIDYLLKELKKLNIKGYSIKKSTELKMGITGTQIDVQISNDSEASDHYHDHGHGHGHGHKHDHSHDKSNSHDHAHQNHNSYKQIKELIINSELSEAVKKTSIDIFERVAVAEAKIHSKTIDDVHFHEVGAVDSIIDIVGAAICFHYLNPSKVLCSTIELGGGFVQCAHGKFPVPAPATTEILKNIPIKKGIVPFETTTPTGAAILASLVDEFTDSPNFSITKTSYGIGHRDLEIPNVLRVYLANDTSENNIEKAKIIECNIDDMPAEQFEFLSDRLFEEGAQDVYLTPIIMKKSRPAAKISVLCSTFDENKLTNILFKESTSLGVRSFPVDKTMLERKVVSVKTIFGDIEVKIGLYDGKQIKLKPEYEQCKEAALLHKVPVRNVIDSAYFEAIKRTQ